MAYCSKAMLITDTTVKEKNGEKKTIAIAVAVALHAFLAIIFIVITVVPELRDEPELVAKVVSSQRSEASKVEKKTVVKQVQQVNPTTAASPIAKMMRANAAAKMVAPSVSKVSDGPIGLGEGEFGVGMGGETKMGSGASFFGSRSTGRRFLFVLDHSASMTPSRLELRDNELKKALYGLPKEVQYQVILFGGGALFAEPGWSSKRIGDDLEVSHRNKRYLFTPFRGDTDWKFKGEDRDLPRSRWLNVTRTNINNSLSMLPKIEEFYGTDWSIALQVAHQMEPSPDVIYFMSDGTGGNATRPILEVNRKLGRPVINTFAMQTTNGAKQFFEIANKTGGEFMIIDGSGKPNKVTDPDEVF